MSKLKHCYDIKNKHGDCTRFHLVKYELIPLKNFELALIWFLNEMLTGNSCKDMEALLSNPIINKKYKYFIKNLDKVVSLSFSICARPLN